MDVLEESNRKLATLVENWVPLCLRFSSLIATGQPSFVYAIEMIDFPLGRVMFNK